MSAIALAFMLQAADPIWEKRINIYVPDEILDQAAPYLQCLAGSFRSSLPRKGTIDRNLLISARDGALAKCKTVRRKAYAASDAVLIKSSHKSSAERAAFVEQSLSTIDHALDSVIDEVHASKGHNAEH